MRDGIFGHLFIGLKAYTFDDALFARDMNIRIRIDAMGLLVPFEFLGIELLAFEVQGMHIAAQGP